LPGIRAALPRQEEMMVGGTGTWRLFHQPSSPGRAPTALVPEWSHGSAAPGMDSDMWRIHFAHPPHITIHEVSAADASKRERRKLDTLLTELAFEMTSIKTLIYSRISDYSESHS
jgi:hypothetical protein